MDHLSDTGADQLAVRVGVLVEANRVVQQMTSSELARRSGLSRTIVAKIERGEGNPSIGTLWRIAKALQVPLGVLLAEDRGPQMRVVRAGEGEAIQDPSGLAGRLLHADARERRSEVFDLELPPGARHASPAHQLGVEECVVVTRGAMEITVSAAEAVTLKAGDAMWFAADRAHVYATVGKARCHFLNWILYAA